MAETVKPTSLQPFLVLRLRAEARAILFYRKHEFASLEEAIQPLWDFAFKSGLLDQLGDAQTKALIEKPFLLELERAADGR